MFRRVKRGNQLVKTPHLTILVRDYVENRGSVGDKAAGAFSSHVAQTQGLRGRCFVACAIISIGSACILRQS